MQGTIKSLAPRRHLPPERRRALTRAAVFFHIEDLNALGDILRDCGRDPETVEVKRQKAWQRCRTIVEALRWNLATSIVHVWEWIEATDRQFPDDIFGPALLLLELVGAADPAVSRWCTALSKEEVKSLAAAGLDVGRLERF